MALAWTWWALPGLLSSAIVLTLAWLVFASRPDRVQNRRLGLYLLLVAINVAVGVYGLAATLTNPSTYLGAIFVQFATAALFLPIYTGFLATLATPLVVPLRWRATRLLLWLVPVTLILATLLRPGAFFQGVVPSPAISTWSPQPTVYAFTLQSVLTVLYVFGLVVAISAYRRARTPTLRRQMGAYAVGFGTFDGVLVAYTLLTQTAWWASDVLLARVIDQLAVPAASIALSAALAYGILRSQLFDIDLKIKFVVEKSTVAAVFAVGFLTASELVERLVGIEGLWFGVGAAVLIGLFFRRVERVGGAVADRLMPGIEDTDEYRTVRKREVYRAAVESALVDGTVTDRERDVLATLADQLGLSAGDAQGIERDLS